jgi:hypothetical protein
MMSNPKLSFELVPRSSWCDNVRSKFNHTEWDRLRKKVYADYQNQCGICHATGRLAAHEIWDYNEQSHIQKLVGMIALCDLCHHVKHIGFAEVLASQGKLNLKRVINHYCKVNECSVRDFDTHLEEAFRIWDKRSQHKWHVDISFLEKPSE